MNTASLKKGSHVWAVGGFLLKQASRSLLGILTAHFNVKILFFRAGLSARTWHVAAYISHPALQNFNKTLFLTTVTVLFSVLPGKSCAPFDLSSSKTVNFVVHFFYALSVSFNLYFAKFLPFSATGLLLTHLSWHLLSTMRIEPTLWFRE